MYLLVYVFIVIPLFICLFSAAEGGAGSTSSARAKARETRQTAQWRHTETMK